MERLRTTLSQEKQDSLDSLRREMDADRRRQELDYQSDLNKRDIDGRNEMEKVIGDMEKKREQDCAMIARKVGLDPDTLSTLLPGSTHLSERIEALHKQAIHIRDMTLAFYEQSHPPTKDVS